MAGVAAQAVAGGGAGSNRSWRQAGKARANKDLARAFALATAKLAVLVDGGAAGSMVAGESLVTSK